MHSVTRDTLVDGLRSLGLCAGQQVLVHSSLSSFGHVAGGAGTVIDALLEVIGSSGTVLVPTLTGSEHLSPENPPVFDPAETPCWTGRIPETFRRRPDAVRSLHATHSVAAIGADAQMLTMDHVRSVTPCDTLSPYGQLAARATGYILLLGVDHESNTTFHHVEEIAGVDYHLQLRPAVSVLRVRGEEWHRHIFLHRYGTPRRFGVMEPFLLERDIQRNTRIGNALVRLVHAPRMVEATLQALRANPRLLCRDG